VEILKFSEPPKRSSRSTTRKKSGVMPLLSVVAAVALVGGMSSTLAGTITLNGGTTGVEFGQGVVTAAACDTTMKVFPTSRYDTSTASDSDFANSPFSVSSIKIQGVGLGNDNGAEGTGCKNKYLTIKAYALNSNTPLTWDTASAVSSIKIRMPNTDTMTGTTIDKSDNGFITFGTPSGYGGSSVVGATSDTQFFILESLWVPSSVVRFTIESSDS
jgi:hypothetical protein